MLRNCWASALTDLGTGMNRVTSQTRIGVALMPLGHAALPVVVDLSIATRPLFFSP